MRTTAKRGRKSVGDLTAARSIQAVVHRQRPPSDLVDEEVEVWAAVVGAEPADWFTPSNAPLLAQYCRHVIHARRVAELIERTLCDLKDPPSIDEYDRLLKMQDRESRAISSLATKMRISQQSTRTHRGNSRSRSATTVPWETVEG